MQNEKYLKWLEAIAEIRGAYFPDERHLIHSFAYPFNYKESYDSGMTPVEMVEYISEVYSGRGE